MYRKIFLLFTFITLFLFTLQAQTKITLDGIEYTINQTNQTATLEKVSKQAPPECIIPDSISYEGKNYAVLSMNETALFSCTQLTSLSLPQSIQSLPDGFAFRCTNLKTITIAKENPRYVSFDGVVYTIQGDTLVQFPPAYDERRYQPLTSLKVIGIKAFYGSKVYTVGLPKGLEEISNEAFMNCKSLHFITLPKSLKMLGTGAFYNCKELWSVYAKMQDLSQVNIGPRIFSCSSSQDEAERKSLATLFVPYNKKEMYEQYGEQEGNPIFKQYAHKIEEMEEEENGDTTTSLATTLSSPKVTIYTLKGVKIKETLGADIFKTLPKGVYLIQEHKKTYKVFIP